MGSEMCIRDRLCVSLGIIIETNAPYIPEGNAIAEHGFGTIMGTTRRLLLGAPHLPGRLWAEAFKAAVYTKTRTPTDVLDGKVPLEVWINRSAACSTFTNGVR